MGDFPCGHTKVKVQNLRHHATANLSARSRYFLNGLLKSAFFQQSPKTELTLLSCDAKNVDEEGYDSVRVMLRLMKPTRFTIQHVLPNPNYPRSLINAVTILFTTTGVRLCPSHV